MVVLAGVGDVVHLGLDAIACDRLGFTAGSVDVGGNDGSPPCCPIALLLIEEHPVGTPFSHIHRLLPPTPGRYRSPQPAATRQGPVAQEMRVPDHLREARERAELPVHDPVNGVALAVRELAAGIRALRHALCVNDTVGDGEITVLERMIAAGITKDKAALARCCRDSRTLIMAGATECLRNPRTSAVRIRGHSHRALAELRRGTARRRGHQRPSYPSEISTPDRAAPDLGAQEQDAPGRNFIMKRFCPLHLQTGASG